MRLTEAQSIIRQAHGRSYAWLQAWGPGLVSEAIRTIEQRKSATDADQELAADVKRRLWERR